MAREAGAARHGGLVIAAAETLGPEALLMAIERYPTSVREGSDSLAVLYWWRRQGGDDDFAAALALLVEDGLIDILPGADPHLRLTAVGFQALSDRFVALGLDPASVKAAAADQTADEDAWQSGNPAPGVEQPASRHVLALRRIFAVLARPAGQSVAAGTLARIWAMESRRGGDLRIALDIMAAHGELSVQRGLRTTFALTALGVSLLPPNAG